MNSKPFLFLIVSAYVLVVIGMSCSRQALKNHDMVIAAQSVGIPDKLPEPVKAPTPTIQKSVVVTQNQIFPTIYFDFDKSDIRSDAEGALRSVSVVAGSLVVSGYADERGSVEYNQRLGMRRAQAVKRALVANGVTVPIWCFSYGKTRLARSGCVDEDCHQLNRRVEIVAK